VAEKLTFDLVTNDLASAGFSAAGRSAAAASDDVQALGKRLDEIGKKSAKARVGLEGDKDADLQLDKLSLKLLKLGRTVTNPKISLDGALKAAVEIKGLELEMDKLNRKAASISASGGGLSMLERVMGSLFGGGAQAAGGGASAGGGALSGILSTPGLGPAVIAGVTAAAAALLVELDGLVSGFAAAGAGLGAFGLLALPTFKAIATAYTGISAAHQKYMDALAKEKQDPTKANAAAVTRALDALKVAQDNLAPSTKTAVGGIQALDDEYHKMAAAFAPDALKVFNDALGIANTLLPDVKPFADTAATAIDGLLKKVGVFFASADFKAWLGSFEKLVGPSLTAIGDGIGKVSVSAGKLFTILSAKDTVTAINIAFDTIAAVLDGTGIAIRFIMTKWDAMTSEFRDSVHAIELVRDETAAIWGKMEEDVLHLALSITNTMGKLPGPLGAPFRAAHTAIQHELSGIEADVAGAERRIRSDWAKLHGVAADITVRADGTFRVGTTGLKGAAAGWMVTGGTPGRDSVLAALMPGELVLPVPAAKDPAAAALAAKYGVPGFGGGGVAGSYGGSVAGVAPWMGREAQAAQAMLEKLTAAAAAAAMKAAQAAAFSGPAGGSSGPGAAAAQAYARSILGSYGWGATQFPPLQALWNGESGWDYRAYNAASGATGIPQALPGSKMASAGADWRTSPATQIRWGLGYIKGRYGSPATAYSDWLGRFPHWYAKGTGGAAPGWGVVGEQGRPELVRFHGGEEVIPAGPTARILSAGLFAGLPGYAAGTKPHPHPKPKPKPDPQQVRWLAELARDVARRDKLAVARTRSDHRRQLALTAEELTALQHPHSKADAKRVAADRRALGLWEARSLAPIRLLNREIALLRTLTHDPDAVRYGGPGTVAAAARAAAAAKAAAKKAAAADAASAAADAAAAAGSGSPGAAAAPPVGPPPAFYAGAGGAGGFIGPGSPAPAVPGGPGQWGGAAAGPGWLAGRLPHWYAGGSGGGPMAMPGPPAGYGYGDGGGQPAAQAGMQDMVAAVRAMHADIVAAVARVAPGVAQGVSRGLDSMARGVVTQ